MELAGGLCYKCLLERGQAERHGHCGWEQKARISSLNMNGERLENWDNLEKAKREKRRLKGRPREQSLKAR